MFSETYQHHPIDLRTLALWSARYQKCNASIEQRISAEGMPVIAYRIDIDANLDPLQAAKTAIHQAVADYIGASAADEIVVRVDSQSAYRRSSNSDDRITLQTTLRKARTLGLTKQKLDDILQRTFAEKIAQVRSAPAAKRKALADRVGGVSNMSLDAILADDLLCDLFFAHAKRESCRENINFLCELRDLKEDTPPDVAILTARSIVQEFCRSDSHQAIDLPSNLRKEFDGLQLNDISLEQLKLLLGCDPQTKHSAKTHVAELLSGSADRFRQLFREAREHELNANPSFSSLKQFVDSLQPEDQIRQTSQGIGTPLYAKNGFKAMQLLNPRSWFRSGRRQQPATVAPASDGRRFRNAKLAVRDALANHFGGDTAALQRANEMMSVLLQKPGAMTKEDLVLVLHQAELAVD